MRYPTVEPLRRQSSGFTLVELLVVVAIIALLLGILLPALSKAREMARRSVAMSNVSQLAKAGFAYTAANRDILPDATPGNAAWQNGSIIGGGGSPGVYYTDLNSNRVPTQPAIGLLLHEYLGGDLSVWSSPATDNSVTDHYEGTSPEETWWPDYYYMGIKEIVNNLGDGWNKANGPHWLVRNVAGLKTAGLKPSGGGGLSDVVTFVDSSPTNHGRILRPGGATSIYGNNNDGTHGGEPVVGEFYSNIAYADGHADGVEYTNRDEYFADPDGQVVLGSPIRQTVYGVDLTSFGPTKSLYP